MPLFLEAFEFFDHFAEFSQREILDLADALARDAEFLADFLQGFFRAAVEAEAVAQNGRFARVEVPDHVLQHAGDGFVFQIFVGRGGVFILDDVGKIIRLVVADGRVERRGANRHQPHLPDAGGGHVEFVGQLLVGRFAAKLLLQTHRDAAHLGNLVHQMHRQADGLGLIGERAFDGLLDPPRTVGRKFAALFRIKALDGLHQADVAFADQIQQRQSDAVVIARDFYDQAEVGLDHQLARFFVALFNARGQLDFLLRREQFHLPDFAQVKFDGRVAVVSRTFPPDELRGVAFPGRFRRGGRWNGRRNGCARGNFCAARGNQGSGCAPFGFGCFAFLPLYRHKTEETLRPKRPAGKKINQPLVDQQVELNCIAGCRGEGDVVKQRQHAADQCGHVSQRRGVQNLAHPRTFLLMYEAQPEQLFLGPAAGVVFHRQRDELEQRHHRKNHNDDGENNFQQAQKDADKENAHVGHARELRDRHQRHAHIEQSVGRLMLERVTGFVRGDADGGHRPAIENCPMTGTARVWSGRNGRSGGREFPPPAHW